MCWSIHVLSCCCCFLTSEDTAKLWVDIKLPPLRNSGLDNDGPIDVEVFLPGKVAVEVDYRVDSAINVDVSLWKQMFHSKCVCTCCDIMLWEGVDYWESGSKTVELLFWK